MIQVHYISQYVSQMFVFNVCVSPRAVTTIEISNVCQIMLMLILITQACVVCVCAYACFMRACVV